MEKNQIKAIADSNRNLLVYMVAKKVGAIKAEDKESLAMLEKLLQRQKTEMMMRGFINQMRQDVKIEYNSPLLNALNIQLNS